MQVFYRQQDDEGSIRKWEASFVRITNAGYGPNPDVREPAGHSKLDVSTGAVEVKQLHDSVDVYESLLHDTVLTAKREGLTSAHVDEAGDHAPTLEAFGFQEIGEAWVINPQNYTDKSLSWSCI